MQRYEYRVVPAPAQAGRVKGLKTAADRFAHGLAEVMNALGRDGWEYVRAESLPCEDRPGMLSRPVTTTVHLLVFRRPLGEPGALPSLAEPAPAPAPALHAAGAPSAAPPPPPVAVRAKVAALPPAESKVRLVSPADRGGGRAGLPRIGAATGKGVFRGQPPLPDSGGAPETPDGRGE